MNGWSAVVKQGVDREGNAIVLLGDGKVSRALDSCFCFAFFFFFLSFFFFFLFLVQTSVAWSQRSLC